MILVIRDRELLAIKINELTGCCIHAGTLCHWLPAAGIVWHRAAPTLRIRAPHKDEKIAAINEVLGQRNAAHPVFYEDEVDIHLNPKIGADWQLRGQQNGELLWDRMKNIISRMLCTAEQAKSVMLVATAKIPCCLSI